MQLNFRFVQLKEPPNGYTPLPRVLNTLLSENKQSNLNERKLLVIIATDGEPTDDSGQSAIREFKLSLKSRSPIVYTTIVVCTDDEESVNYLNRWDRKLPRLDVIDDYRLVLYSNIVTINRLLTLKISLLFEGMNVKR